VSRELISKWGLEGRLFLGRSYLKRRRESTWNLFVDNEGCRSMQNLIKLLLGSNHPVKREIALQRSEPFGMHGDEWHPSSRLTLRYLADRVAPDFAKASLPTPNDLELKLGSSALAELDLSFQEAEAGRDDFCQRFPSGKGELELWFWVPHGRSAIGPRILED
jgi:hypothetical protein